MNTDILKLKKNAIVTIVTPNYLDKGLACIHSAKKYNKEVECYILYLDLNCPYTFKNINILTIRDIEQSYRIVSKKYGHLTNCTRWSLKPVILLHLLNIHKKIVYVDPDIYFVNSWNFIFDKINSMLLSPHHCYLDNFINSIFGAAKFGYFNAGFIGCSRLSMEALRVWASLCYNRCEMNHTDGLYVDQKYLDYIYMMNNIFDGITQLDDFGCNIAHWNLHKSLQLYRNIFFHFSTVPQNYQKCQKFPEFLKQYNRYNKLSKYINKYLLNNMQL